MCVQLLATALGTGASVAGALSSPTGNPAADRRTAGNLEAAATAADTLGALAMSSTRARLARAEARGERATAAQRASRIRRQGDFQMGENRAQVGAMGVRLTSDSILEAERSLDRAISTDAAIALANGENRAAGLSMQAAFTEAAGLNTLLAGAADAAGRWRRSRSAVTQQRAPQFNPVGDGFTSDPYAGP